MAVGRRNPNRIRNSEAGIKLTSELWRHLEGVLDVADPGAARRQQYPDGAGALRRVHTPMAIDPDPGATHELATLSPPHCLHRISERRPAPSLHLHEGYHVVAPRYEIQVTVPAAEPMGNDRPPVQ